MGNWKNRPPRRFYRHQRPPSPPRYDAREPLSAFCNDGVPLWEKKFCSLIGSVPWRKIVDTKNYMCCYGNVANWDDSAGEEAFQNAKRRYWAEINGFPCEISLPDPDIYIDDINWNPYIDPELINDLDREYFAPDCGENESKLMYKEECNWNVDNPWEWKNDAQCSNALQDKDCWGMWGEKINDSNHLDSVDNQWECSFNKGSETRVHNTWGQSDDKSWGLSQWEDHVNQSRDWGSGQNAWEHRSQGFGSMKKKGQGNLKDNPCGWKQQGLKKLDNREKPWGNDRWNDGAPSNRGWGDHGSWQWRQRGNFNSGPRKLDFRKNGAVWEATDGGCRKREGSHQYVSSYKSSKFQGDDDLAGRCWRSGKTSKRVSFGFE